ncbi:hypothetical protein QQS21_012884 [Conoideocrella luteorostrata]|uniref:Dynamin-type G domain-containing protein n=1 Tax=Conoideocrella luteorostrata TaxID=1105319 RepID=A0AAJ0FSA3_9HYPO|nr:hypothetical protein QQS21_012884 [Conoideocrella luteorostrata]
MAAAVDMQSTGHRHLLDTIDKLRAQGISRHVDLPQIVVTGDQSAGKSSVFLCTRFATQLSVRRSPSVGLKASIIQGPNRSQPQKEKLQQFCPYLKNDNLDLTCLVELAEEEMGITPEFRAFSEDILRIEISGPQQPHLTMVDLPGLFQAGNSTQSDKDSEIVAEMVFSYMRRPRSIILAVVSAKSDFTLQQVTRPARQFDPQGDRTLGLITKPDTLDGGSDSEASMAQNKASPHDRDRAEAEFFSKGVWAMSNPSTVGVVAMRSRLSNVLKNQIVAQLPNLLLDVEGKIVQSKTKLKKPGTPLVSIAHKRHYLLLISQQFSQLMEAAVGGLYNDSFFGSARTEEGSRRRLRAIVQMLLTNSKDIMHEKGCSRVTVEDEEKKDDRPLKDREILRSQYIEEVGDFINKNRSIELHETFNPLIVGEPYPEQCRPWAVISKILATELLAAVHSISHAMVHHVAMEETADKLDPLIYPSIHKLGVELEESFECLIRPHQELHPITYSHALTENVHKAQTERREGRANAQIENECGPPVPVIRPSRQEIRISRGALKSVLTADVDADMMCYGSALAVDSWRLITM